ncbi:MAG: cytochrome b N-terminal domain-containing protein [Polyangiaceae bacterium]|nr:cytochrome b N-terminal domain-containing protein [Polyangiaceae bacterium]
MSDSNDTKSAGSEGKKQSIGDWFEERTGYRALLGHALNEPVRGGAKWAYIWGSALVLTFVIQAVTGYLLMSAYTPSATTAWASVAHITFTMRAGWIVRGLHHFGAQAMVILLVGHLAQTALFGAYKRPREMNWFLGLALMGVTLAFALTGYLLPWDQKGYWATRVATNIVGSVPAIGPWLQSVLVGGPEYGHMTLTRFYSLHVGVLPAALVLLLVLHVALFRKHGVTPPAHVDEPGAPPAKVDSFFPKQVGMDLLFGLAILGGLFALAWREHGAPLDAPADPASDYPARPEWYFLALFEMLKHLPGSMEAVGAVGVPLVLGGYLVALPFIDRKPTRALKARIGILAPLVLMGLGAVALTVVSMRNDAADPAFQKARQLASERSERSIALFKKGVPPEGPLAMLRRDPETRGPELFAANCASCHKLGDMAPPEGKVSAPDLTTFGTRAWVIAVLDDPDGDHMFGKTPFKGNMPSVAKPPADPEAAKDFKPMSDADKNTIADFLVAQAKGDRAEGSAGEKLVKRRCTGCHRLDGKQDESGSEESLAPELRGWASVAWIQAQIDDPGSGKAYPKGAGAPELKGKMPGFADKLDAADRTLLANWLHRRSQVAK